MMYCSNCGKEIPDGSAFCGYCGAAVGAAQPGGEQPSVPPSQPGWQAPAPPPQAPVPPPPAAGPAPVAGPGPQAYAPPPPGGAAVPPVAGPPGGYAATAGAQPPKKKSALPWILGAVGLLVVAAVVLVLVFVVFKGGKAEKADTSGPEEVVRLLFRSMEKEDAGMFLDLMEPSFREELEDTLGKHLDTFFEYFFQVVPDDVRFDIRKLDTKVDGDRATVTVVEGTMTYTDENGKKVSEEASEGDLAVFELVRVGGKWYFSGEFMKELGFDLDELKDLDLDALEDLTDGGGDLDGGTTDGTDTTDGKPPYEDEEMAVVESAMLDYVYRNSEEGLEFAITGLLIRNDEAVGIAVCTNVETENFPVVMKNGPQGWYGVSLGAEGYIPDWFLAEMAEVEEAMLTSAYANAAAGLELEVNRIAIRDREAVGIVVCTNQELEDVPIVMKRGSGGWYMVDFGTGIDVPAWYWPQAY